MKGYLSGNEMASQLEKQVRLKWHLLDCPAQDLNAILTPFVPAALKSNAKFSQFYLLNTPEIHLLPSIPTISSSIQAAVISHWLFF